ncbi:hypothetical protein LIER_06051 [Lithospermum erythrorhizon]|uniref:Phytocyanin domain-containing protein n=1 Tax=Lithospermum erythrorhizon TaxID=34254 RepID=A0AAV3P3T1_LITER
MTCIKIPRCQFWYALQFLLLLQTNVLCYQYKVGDLAAWAIPTNSNKNVYAKWPKNQDFKIGDSLFFLYPPSEDSVIQVTKEAYRSCNTKDPILKINDGNSLFNITEKGEFFFTSGEDGHCQKGQKLYISLLGNASYAESPDYSPNADAPSYPTVFGSIPAQSSPSTSSSFIIVPLSVSFLLFICALMSGLI